MIKYESYHNNKEYFLNDYLLWASIVCSATMIPMIFTHKCLKLEYLKYKGVLREGHNIFNTGMIWDALLEVLISCIMPYSKLKCKLLSRSVHNGFLQ
jgi:hypothetical protein